MKRSVFVLLFITCLFSLTQISCSDSGDNTDDETMGDKDPEASDGDLDIEDSEIAETGQDGDEEIALEEEMEEEMEPFVACHWDAGCFDLPYQINRLHKSENMGEENRLPFPYDYFTIADDKTPTGLMTNLIASREDRKYRYNSRLIDPGLRALGHYRYARAANTLDGFGTSSTILLECGAELADGVLPEDPALSTAADSPILLLNLDSDSDDYGKAVPFVASLMDAREDDDEPESHLYWYIMLKPQMPLDASTKYGVFVNNNLMSKDGQKPQMSEHFQQVWGVSPLDEAAKAHADIAAEKERLAYLKNIADELEIINAEETVLAFDFTTQSVNHDIDYIVDLYESAEFVTPNLDWDSDGEINFYAPDEYPSSLPNRPGVDSAYVSYLITGEFEIPEWRHCKNKNDQQECYYEFKRDSDYKPMQNGTNQTRFFMYFPKDPVQPMPLALAQHGIYSQKESVGKFVTMLLQSGSAVMLIDLPFHGDREVGLPPLEFLDVNYPLKATSNFKQAFTEHAYIFKAAATGAFDVWPNGEGDGTPDFDPERLGYFSHSLGSIIGATSVAVSPDADMAVLSVGGAGLFDFVEGGFGEIVLMAFSEEEVKQYGLIAQTVLDSGDGINYIHRFKAKHAAGKLQILAHMAMEDETIPAIFSMNYSRLAGLEQVEPVLDHIGELKTTSAPYSGGKGLFQYPEAKHCYITSGSDVGIKAREQCVEFLTTFFANGTGIVINPYEESEKH